MKRLLSIMLSIFPAVLVVIGIMNNALAHERRDVGKYQVVVVLGGLGLATGVGSLLVSRRKSGQS